LSDLVLPYGEDNSEVLRDKKKKIENRDVKNEVTSMTGVIPGGSAGIGSFWKSPCLTVYSNKTTEYISICLT
jgi:hypothetical protein